MIQLYDYFRSSASYRVRIALYLKGIDAEVEEVHLVNNGGEQNNPAYLEKNPQGLVPTLKVDETYLTQSLAILDYLEQQYPDPNIYPKESKLRCHALSLALIIVSDIHPLNNLRVLNYLKAHFNAEENTVKNWYHHWLNKGFDAIEQQLAQLQTNPDYCIGNQITIADICLIPQVYNAMRFKFSLDKYPRIRRVYESCMTQAAFNETKP